VAQRAGLSLRFYSQLEKGEANIAIGRLAAVAEALAFSLPDLLAVESEPRPRAIALIGLRGSGKSTVGPLLAAHFGMDFVELDGLIESEAGLSLTEIFELHGESYYRRLEHQCINGLLDAEEPVVVALSGGIVSSGEVYGQLLRACTTIWLKAEPADHMQRVIDQGDHRPMQDRENAMAELRAILAARSPLYGKADIQVDTSKDSLDGVLDRLDALLTERGWVPTRDDWVGVNRRGSVVVPSAQFQE
jgi:XRE family aerobic/anaerobic benzoate catabolism transcriptional regulator